MVIDHGQLRRPAAWRASRRHGGAFRRRRVRRRAPRRRRAIDRRRAAWEVTTTTAAPRSLAGDCVAAIQDAAVVAGLVAAAVDRARWRVGAQVEIPLPGGF